jgi:hypothetical protein
LADCQVDGCTQPRLRTSDGSTKGLIGHLRTVHNIEEKPRVAESQPPQKKQKTILQFVKYSTLQETVARLICENNYNFTQIAACQYMRNNLMRDFGNYPKTATDVRRELMKFYRDVELKTKTKISELLERDIKFCCTTDEWTSSANRRYMNVNIHYHEQGKPKFINLGLKRMNGSWPAAMHKKKVSYHCFQLYV